MSPGGAADGAPVAPGVLQQRVVLGQPHRSQAALGHVVGDDAGDLAALAAAGAVAEEEAPPKLERACDVPSLTRISLVRRLAERSTSPAEACDVRLAGIDHRLHLGVGHQARRRAILVGRTGR